MYVGVSIKVRALRKNREEEVSTGLGLCRHGYTKSERGNIRYHQPHLFVNSNDKYARITVLIFIVTNGIDLGDGMFLRNRF